MHVISVLGLFICYVCICKSVLNLRIYICLIVYGMILDIDPYHH